MFRLVPRRVTRDEGRQLHPWYIQQALRPKAVSAEVRRAPNPGPPWIHSTAWVLGLLRRWSPWRTHTQR